jgi:hypothetical protein
MCQKIAYNTKLEAQADAKQIKAQDQKFSKKTAKYGRPGKAAKMKPYNCRYCGKFHLTTQKQRKRGRK